MSPRFEIVDATLEALDADPPDVLVLAVFSDERPLEGLAGRVDWRLCGSLSRWFQGGFATGAWEERVLYPTRHRLGHARVLLLGLGRRARHRTDRAHAAAELASRTVTGLGRTRMTCGLFGLQRLPTPLDRSVPDLVRTLAGQPELEHVRIALEPELREPVANALTAFHSSARR